MKTCKKLLGLLLAAAIITSMLTLPALADGNLSVSTNEGGAAAYGNSSRYYFDMSNALSSSQASFDSGLTGTWNEDPKDSGNKVLKVVSNAENTGVHTKLKFKNADGTSSYQGPGPNIAGFDFMISDVVAADSVAAETQKELLSPRFYGPGNNWMGGAVPMVYVEKTQEGSTVIKTNGGSVINGDQITQNKNGAVIEQDKWYTCYIYTDYDYTKEAGSTNNLFACHLYMSEKGKTFEDAWYVSTFFSYLKLYEPNELYLLTYGNATKSGFTYYVDNVFIDKAVSIEDTKVCAQKGEEIEVDFFVAPGFTSATVSAFGKEAAITDNGTGYYTFNIDVPENAEFGMDSISVNAVYPKTHLQHSNGKDITATASAIPYQYMMIGGTTPYLFNFDDGNANQDLINAVNNATTAFSTDNGFNYVNNNSDKSLKIDFTAADDNGAYLLLGINNGVSPTSPTNAIVRFKGDFKFDRNDIQIYVQNKGTGWKNVTCIDTAAKKFSGSDLDFKAGEWYSFEIIYNLAEKTIESFVNGVQIGDKIVSDYINKLGTTNFYFDFPKGAENKSLTIWADNISKEIAPVYGGIKNYNPVSESNSPFSVEFEGGIFPALLSAEVLASDGTSAGSAEFVTTDDVTTLMVTPSAFDTKRDITLVIKSAGEELERKTYIMKDNETQTISEISLSQDSNYVYANIKAMSAEAVGTLYLVGYNADFTRLTNVSIVPLSASETLKNFGVKLTKGADDVNYKAFLWSPSYAPVETAMPLAKN